MQLDSVLRDKAAGLANPDLGHRDVVRALLGIGPVDGHRCQHRPAAALLHTSQPSAAFTSQTVFPAAK